MRTFVPLGVILMALPAAAADPPQFHFPDPLLMTDGTKVTTKDQWEAKRKPELKELFQQQMYGRYPAVKTAVSGKVLFDDPKAFGGVGTLREIELSTGVEKCPPMYLLIAVPNERPKNGSPVFVGINFAGNHTLTTDDRVRIPTAWMPANFPGVKNNKATAAGRGQHAEKYPLEMIVKAGYAVATFYTGDVDPDNKEKREGMRNAITPFPPGELPNDFPASIMCWAWGVHRAVDYVTTQPEFDPKRVAVVGHSRLGKTALLAAAFDDRIAVAFPLQAGCGGTAPSRHADPKAETVKRINTSFPHWFCGNFKKYNDDPNKLPFDQHSLLALCAPRPVLYANATEDLWANPAGQFDMMRRASPVYELVAGEGMAADTMPETGKLVDSRLGYWIRPGKHEMNPDDWKTFLTYADKWLK